MDLTALSATQLARVIRDRRASALEAVDAHLARIDRHGAAINAVVTLDAERARRRAREADESLARGAPCGPLHGVPFTLKDHHHTAGVRTTAGIRGSEHVPERDGIVAARLQAAGGILIGKTNMAMSVQTISELFGCTSNPWDASRTVGGSSGGAAAAVAARLSPFDVGTDASGSIRMPAHFCGVFGLKTTVHRVPFVGLTLGPPGAPRLDRDTAAIGPIARTAEDLGLVASILSGGDPRDPESPPVPFGGVPRLSARDIRLAALPAIPGLRVQREQVEALERLAGRLAAAGVRVDMCESPIGFDELLAAFRRHFAILASTLARFGLAPPGAPKGDGPSSAYDLLLALDERDRASARLERFLEGYDALLCPTAISTAFSHRPSGSPIEVDGDSVSSVCIDHPCLLASYTGAPAVVVPVALDSHGLPIGAQLVGRRWQDARLVGVAAAVGEIAGELPAPDLEKLA